MERADNAVAIADTLGHRWLTCRCVGCGDVREAVAAALQEGAPQQASDNLSTEAENASDSLSVPKFPSDSLWDDMARSDPQEGADAPTLRKALQEIAAFPCLVRKWDSRDAVCGCCATCKARTALRGAPAGEERTDVTDKSHSADVTDSAHGEDLGANLDYVPYEERREPSDWGEKILHAEQVLERWGIYRKREIAVEILRAVDRVGRPQAGESPE